MADVDIVNGYEPIVLGLVRQLANQSVPLEFERLLFQPEPIGSVVNGRLSPMSENSCEEEELKPIRNSMGNCLNGCLTTTEANPTPKEKVKLKFTSSAFNSTTTTASDQPASLSVELIPNGDATDLPQLDDSFFDVTPQQNTSDRRHSRKKDEKRHRSSHKRRRSSATSSDSERKWKRRKSRDYGTSAVVPKSHSSTTSLRVMDGEELIRAALRKRDASRPRYFPFFGRQFVFSNHHRCDIRMEGRMFNCTEQYYMFKKADLFGDAKTAEQILNATDPKVQKKLSMGIEGFNKQVWYDRYAKKVMTDITIAKYRQHQGLRLKLFDKFSCCFVEANPFDHRWGVKLALDDPNIYVRSNWNGANWLGEILNVVRDTLMLEAEYRVEATAAIRKQIDCS